MNRFITSLLLGVALFSLASCASVTSLGMDPSIPRTIVQQRSVNDCVIASLAMTLDLSYETVEATRQALNIPFTDGGLDQTKALAIAKALGKPLRVVKATKVNLITAQGMLVVGQADGQPFHAVYVEQGFIFDPQSQMAQPWVLWFQPREETFIAYLLERR
jgi:hypothetical protein